MHKKEHLKLPNNMQSLQIIVCLFIWYGISDVASWILAWGAGVWQMPKAWDQYYWVREKIAPPPSPSSLENSEI